MENITPTPEEAADLLVRGSTLTGVVGDADTGRRRIYAIWALVLPLSMMWFDILDRPGAAVLAMVPFVLIAVAATMVVVRQQQVTDMSAMKSYVIVMATFAFAWTFLVGFVGPRLGESYSLGWTLTGLLGAIPFIGGYIWDRSQ